MGIANKERFLPNHQVSKMARDASRAPIGGVDFGNWNVVDTKKILNNIKMTVGAVLVLGGLGTACGKPTEGTTQIPKTTPTVSPKPTDIPPSPTLEFKPTPTEVPTLAPTPTAVIEMGVSEMAIGGEETDILKPFDRIVRVQISKNDFESKNSGLTLLVPRGETSQAIVQFQKDDQTWILGNFNLPVFKEGQVEFQPQFNTPDFVFLMGWVDNEGNWLYHVPLMPAQEGKAPVVYQKDNQLYQGLLDLATGKIDPASEKPYWQEMPQEAVKAVMAKYGDAVYVTFWDRDGNQLEDKRIKVCDLPPEPTPTPEPASSVSEKFLEGLIPEGRDLLVDARGNSLEVGYYQIYEGEPKSATVHLVLIDILRKDNYVFLMVGTQDQATKQRVILPIIIGKTDTEFLNRAYFWENPSAIPFFHDVGSVKSTFIEVERLIPLLKENYLGKPFRLNFELEEYPDLLVRENAPQKLQDEFESLFFPHIWANNMLIYKPLELAKKIGNIKNPKKISLDNAPFSFGIIKVWKGGIGR